MNDYVRITTTDKLAAVIAPFVGAKLNRQRDPNSQYGRVLPLRRAVDIHAASVWVHADFRSVDADGVRVFFYDRCHLVPWDQIKAVVIRALDEDDERTIAETRYEHVGQRARRAA